METEAIQIVDSNGENDFTFNEEALSNILNDPKIKYKPVCVVSIAGAFRQGKSFLLNFLLRYLALKKIDDVDVGNFLDPKYGRLKGFNWQPGDEAHTLGIVMWPEIFLAEDSTGQEIAIILLDTQGTFDEKSTYSNCATMFALSTLISSVQIYNLMNDIGQDHLNHLQCFTEYGKWAQADKSPFQKLLFLVRDWRWPTKKPFGFKGGKKLLDSRLDTSAKVASEIISQRKNIKQLFTTIECFLMPKPGDTVSESTDFDGDLNDINDQFLQYVQQVVSSILKPQNLVIKQVSGENVTAGDLFLYIKSYMKCFQREDKPTIKSVYLASVEANHMVAVEEAELKFNNYIEDAAKNSDQPYLDEMQLEIILQKAELEAMQHYQGKEKLGNNKKIDENCKSVLQGKLQKIMDNFKEINAMKQAKEEERIKLAVKTFVENYTAKMEKLIISPQFCEDEQLFDQHQKTKKQSLKDFKDDTKSAKYSDALENEIEVKFEGIKQKNKSARDSYLNLCKAQCENLASKATDKYTEEIEKLIASSFREDEDLYKEHEKIKKESFKYFDDNTKSVGDVKAKYSDKLENEIEAKFEKIQKQNKSAKDLCKEQCKNFLSEAVQMYSKSTDGVAERCSKEDFLENHREAERTVTEFFTNETKSYPQSITQNFLAELKNKIRASHDNNNTTFEREGKIAQLKLERILEKSVEKYRKFMRRTDLDDDDNLTERHKEAKGEATNFFQSETKNFGKITDSFLTQMQEQINHCFDEIQQYHFKHREKTEITKLQIITKTVSDIACQVLPHVIQYGYYLYSQQSSQVSNKTLSYPTSSMSSDDPSNSEPLQDTKSSKPHQNSGSNESSQNPDSRKPFQDPSSSEPLQNPGSSKPPLDPGSSD